MSDRPWYRKRIDAFRRIDPATRERVVAAGDCLRIVRRGLVQNRLAAATSVVWVLSGRIRLSIFDEHGAETALAVLEPGECFGPIPRHGSRVVGSAEALEDAEVLVLSADAAAHEPAVARLLEEAGVPTS